MKRQIMEGIKDVNIGIMWYMCDRSPDKKVPKIGKSQIRVLNYLMCTKDEVYQKDIEKILGSKRSTVSSILSHMEEEGYIVRIHGARDNKQKQIIVPEETKEKIFQTSKMLYSLENTLKKDISQEDLECYHRVIKQMIKNLEEARINE